jgi:hypothetical protein
MFLRRQELYARERVAVLNNLVRVIWLLLSYALFHTLTFARTPLLSSFPPILFTSSPSNSRYLPALTFIHRLPREQEVFKLRAEVARLKEQRRHSMADEETLPAIRHQLLMLQEIVCLWEFHACMYRFARTRWRCCEVASNASIPKPILKSFLKCRAEGQKPSKIEKKT